MGNEQNCSDHMYYWCTRVNLIIWYYSLYDIDGNALKVGRINIVRSLHDKRLQKFLLYCYNNNLL